MEKHTIHLTINGEKYELRVAPNELLVNVIRETRRVDGYEIRVRDRSVRRLHGCGRRRADPGLFDPGRYGGWQRDYHHRGGGQSGRHP